MFLRVFILYLCYGVGFCIPEWVGFGEWFVVGVWAFGAVCRLGLGRLGRLPFGFGFSGQPFAVWVWTGRASCRLCVWAPGVAVPADVTSRCCLIT